ncbi:uncharacterized protein At4g06598-like [Cornus florida]|uniref:uncharacterized protein At4g06598-like n=1 Tax=Cornus florida TaxID=4283 RepID=UPI0028A17E07|nr:uncharacterized protein At4g06598-like [Cornus florida]
MSRQTLLPPISPFPRVSSSYVDSSVVGSQSIPKPTEKLSYQRCSSESFLLEEQPSWLDDLLNEPETLVHRGHRRSSSDSLAYAGTSAKTCSTWERHKLKNIIGGPSWGSQNFVHYKDSWSSSSDTKPRSFDKQNHRVNESSLKNVTCSSGLSSTRDGISLQTSVSSCALPESDGVPSTATEKCDQEERGSQNQESSTERINLLQAKPSVSKIDAKRAKQQSAQRSRIRKLQYIAELERHVHVLQAEGSEVSAELEFLDQRNLILGMENRALRQRLDSLSQEQLIKNLEQDMLEREIGRLKSLYQLQMMQQQQKQQQQQQHHHQQKQHSKHHRSKSRDLEPQMANLSIEHKEADSSSGSVNSSVHI